GLGGIYIKGGSFTRIVNNYVETYGSVAGFGNMIGIYVQDIGVGGTIIANNTINMGAQGNGNTWYGVYLENLSAGGFAKWAMGTNSYYTSGAGGTCVRVIRNVSNFPSLAYVGQVYSGSFAHVLDIDTNVNLVNGGVGGSYNMAASN